MSKKSKWDSQPVVPEFALDEWTGLPQPPLNHFWRIAESYLGSPSVRLYLMRERTWRKAQAVDYKLVSDVRDRELLIAEANSLLRRRKIENHGQRYLGDYPPRRLP